MGWCCTPSSTPRPAPFATATGSSRSTACPLSDWVVAHRGEQFDVGDRLSYGVIRDGRPLTAEVTLTTYDWGSCSPVQRRDAGRRARPLRGRRRGGGGQAAGPRCPGAVCDRRHGAVRVPRLAVQGSGAGPDALPVAAVAAAGCRLHVGSRVGRDDPSLRAGLPEVAGDPRSAKVDRARSLRGSASGVRRVPRRDAADGGERSGGGRTGVRDLAGLAALRPDRRHRAGRMGLRAHPRYRRPTTGDAGRRQSDRRVRRQLRRCPAATPHRRPSP